MTKTKVEHSASWLRSGFSVIAGMWLAARFGKPPIGWTAFAASFGVLLTISLIWLCWDILVLSIDWHRKKRQKVEVMHDH